MVYAFNRGNDAPEIQRQFDTQSLAEIHAAIACYLHNQAKVDAYLRQNEIDHEKRACSEHNYLPHAPTREMLLARKNGTDPDRNK